MKRLVILKMAYCLLMLIFTVFSQTWEDDSLVIRQILDTNDLDSITVESVVWNKDSSGRVTTLWFNDLPALHILPASINKLNRLSVLTIEKTGLSDLPKEIGDIKSLQNLELKYNKLTSLASEIGNLPLLNALGIDHEPGIKTLPPEIGKLSSLRLFGARYNNLSKLPDEICNLDSLKSLTLHNNKLTEIPQNIGNLTALQHVYLDYNCLKSLPQSITNLSLPPSEFDVCYNDSLVFTQEQCDWYHIKDYEDYFRLYCPVEIEQEHTLKPIKGILSRIVTQGNRVQFNLRLSTYMDIRLYDMHGRMVAQPFKGYKKAGAHSVAMNTGECGAGVLYLTIRAGQECHRKAIVMLK